MNQTKHSPQISIVIPCLNEEGILKQLLHDLSLQTYPLFETIIVDGGSSDKTINEIQEYQSKLEFKLVLGKEKNVCAQKNTGAKQATTKWLIFIDADTRISPSFLQGIKYRIDQTSSDFLTTYMIPDSDNKKDQAITTLVNIYIETQKRTSNPSAIEAMLIASKKAFMDLDGFDSDISWGEGGDILHRAHKRGYKLEVCRTPTYTYSMRRIRKEGTLKIARSVAQIETARLLGISLSNQKYEELYPMNGGEYHQQASGSSQGQIQNILFNLKKIKTVPDSLKSVLRRNLPDF